MELYNKCECGELNLKDKKYCGSCGKYLINNRELEREYNVGKIEALSHFREKFYSWFIGIATLLGLLSFLGYSDVKKYFLEQAEQVKKTNQIELQKLKDENKRELEKINSENKLELEKIKTNRDDLKKTYQELSILTEDLKELFGLEDIATVFKYFMIDAFTIKDIELRVKYTYDGHCDIETFNKIPLFKYISFYAVEKKDISRDTTFMQFKVIDSTAVGDNQMLVKYNLFSIFDNHYISTTLDNLNGIKYMRLASNRHLYDKSVFEVLKKHKIINVTVDFYVNNLIFWSVNLNKPNIKYGPDYSNPFKNNMTKKEYFYMNSDFVNVKKEFIPVNQVLKNIYSQKSKYLSLDGIDNK